MANLRSIQDISKYKNIILNLLIIIIALFISNNIYKGQNRTIEGIKQKSDAELKRNKVMASILRLDKTINAYQRSVNSKDMSLIISDISKLAQDSQVDIAYLKPSAEKAEAIYVNFPFELNVTAESFHNVAKFISSLESSSNIYIIDDLLIKKKTDTAASKWKTGVTAQIKLKTILVESKAGKVKDAKK